MSTAASGDIIDRIDAIVDDQLANYDNRSGYDHNINQETCPRCSRHWHGLPLTAHVASMYRIGRYDPEYLTAEDTSPIVCEGSEFIGPRRPLPHETPEAIAQRERQAEQLRARRDIAFSMIIGVADEFNRSLGLVTASFEALSEAARIWYHGPVATGVIVGGQRTIRGLRAGQSYDFIVFDEPFHNPPENVEIDWWTTATTKITFGPHNWHHEIATHARNPNDYTTTLARYDRPWLQMHTGDPALWPDDPLTRTVRHLWPTLTTPPPIPTPEAPGYDFSQYTLDPPWPPQHTRPGSRHA